MIELTSPSFAPDADALSHSRRLVELIVAEVERAGGWIGFDRYMELALYAPGLGYYAAGTTKFGAAGDFVTAPEISSLFAQTLARQVGELVAATIGDVLELGAGSGSLAFDLLMALADLDRLPQRYLILERSAELKARQQERLGKLDAALAARVDWIDHLPDTLRGVILANEVLDALPTHLVTCTETGCLERGVRRLGNAFAWEDRAIADPRLLGQALQLGLASPYVSEINLAVPALVRTLSERLTSGALLFVDYGFGERELYHPQRQQGTLMCHYRHHAHDDPFFLPGLQDITSHVDFTAVARAGSEAGLNLLGYTTQAQFLINLGITELIARTPADAPAAYLPLAAQAQALLSPAEMGELFKVIALGRHVDVPVAGFRSGDKSRLL